VKVVGLCFDGFQELRCRRNRGGFGCVERNVCKEAVQPTNLNVPRFANAHHREDIEIFAVLPIDNISVSSILSSLADVIQNVTRDKPRDLPVIANFDELGPNHLTTSHLRVRHEKSRGKW